MSFCGGSGSIKSTVERSIKAIDALQRKQGVTIRELAEILDLRSNQSKRSGGDQTAKRYIDAVSLYLPVAEIGERFYPGQRGGRKSIVYGLMK